MKKKLQKEIGTNTEAILEKLRIKETEEEPEKLRIKETEEDPEKLIIDEEPIKTKHFDNTKLIKLITKKLNLINEINMKK